MWTTAPEWLTGGLRWPPPTGSRWAGRGRRDRGDRRRSKTQAGTTTAKQREEKVRIPENSGGGTAAAARRGTVNLIPLSLPLAYGDRDPRDVSETMVATGRYDGGDRTSIDPLREFFLLH